MRFLNKDFFAPLTDEEIYFVLVQENGQLGKNSDGNWELFFIDAEYDDGPVWSASEYSREDVIKELVAEGWELNDDDTFGPYCSFPQVNKLVYDTFVEKVSQKGINCNFGKDIDIEHPLFRIYYNTLTGYVWGMVLGYYKMLHEYPGETFVYLDA